MGHSRVILGHLGSFGVIFGTVWAILGNFWPFLGHFVAFLDKFAESSNFFAAPLGSWGLLLECMGGRGGGSSETVRSKLHFSGVNIFQG